jgi:hypothetical protein
MPVLPGMIEVVILVVAAGMSDPVAGVRIHVRSCRVTGTIRLPARRKRRVFARTVRGNIPTADFWPGRRGWMAGRTLREARKREHAEGDDSEGANGSFQRFLQV